MGKGRGNDEAKGIRDEDEGDNSIVNGIGLLKVGDEGTRGTVINAISKVHESRAYYMVFVYRGVSKGLEEVNASRGSRR